MNLELKSAQWLIENKHLFFSNDIDEKFMFSWSYNRLSEEDKNKVAKYLIR